MGKMLFRVPRHVRKLICSHIVDRLKLLESLLLEIHDIDNRLKMELLSLTSMTDANLGDISASGAEDSQFLSFSDHSEVHTPYELIDLGGVSELEDLTGLHCVDMDEDAVEPSTLEPFDEQCSAHPVNYLFGLINESSLTIPPKKDNNQNTNNLS